MIMCRECSFPRLVSTFIRWQDNGTVVQLMRKNFRVVILHHGFLENLFSNIEAKIGISIEHLAFEAQRNASKATFDAFKTKLPGTNLFLKFKFVRRISVEFFHKVGVLTGMALSETVEYVPGRLGVARFKNPFNMDLMSANVVGAFESLEGIPFAQTWEKEPGGTYLIHIEATGEKPEISERLSLEYEPLLPGNLQFDRCPRCKVPWALANSLKWMESEGTIVDTRTGARVIFLDGYMIKTVFRELAAELGDEIYDLMVEAQKDWTIDNVGELGLSGGDGPLTLEELEAAYREYLKVLPLYGYGNPVKFEMHDGAVSLVVENPYEPSILAGTFQGLYEALEKKRSAVTWEKTRPGVVSFTVTPL
jgi:hypothetical protein